MARKNKYAQFSKAKPFVDETEQFIHDAELDFHSFGVLNVFDIEKILTEFVEDSFVAGYKNLLVIVGKGKVVRPEAKRLLGQNDYVETFRTAGYFNGQDGALEVVLKANK